MRRRRAARQQSSAICPTGATPRSPGCVNVMSLSKGPAFTSVTDTPALRKIPGNEQIVESARARNPAGRLTTPEDVAACLLALCAPGAHWLTGSVLNVDGGEDVAG